MIGTLTNIITKALLSAISSHFSNYRGGARITTWNKANATNGSKYKESMRKRSK